MAEFDRYLTGKHGEPVEGEPTQWKIIQNKMKDIIISTVLATEDMVVSRKSTFELFGYDFMIDDNLNPWLI